MKYLVGACLLVAGLAQTAVADPGDPGCPLLGDPVHDVSLMPDSVPNQGAMDLVRADLTATEDGVTAVLEVRDVPQPEPGNTYEYRIRFVDDVADYVLVASLTGVADLPVGWEYELLVNRHDDSGVDPGVFLNTSPRRREATGSVDAGSDEITITGTAAVFDEDLSGRTWDLTEVWTYRGAMGVIRGPHDTVDVIGQQITTGACA